MRYFALRRAIHSIGTEEGVPVWVAELKDPPVEPDPDDWAAPIKGCSEELWASDLLIVVLASRSGKPYKLGSSLGRTAASVFEVELFHASNWGVPTVFFLANGYEPEPELLNLIDILRLRDNCNWWQLDEQDIEREVRALLRHLKTQSASDAWKLRFIPDRFAHFRVADKAEAEIESTKLSLIGRFAPVGRSDFSDDRFHELFAQCDPTQVGSRYHQLSFLWMALRELSIGEAAELARLPLWQKLAEEWSKAGAWLGLHGYLNTSVISALHTQNALRQLGMEQPVPYGRFASELYSIGRLVQGATMKRKIFSWSAQHASNQIQEGNGISGHSTRAAARAQLARLGRPWLALGALSDFQRSYDLRRKLGRDDASVGMALARLGYAQFQLAGVARFRWRGALQRMEEGIKLMPEQPTIEQAGFVVRAKRNYAECLYEARRKDYAMQVLQEASAMAQTYGLADQIRQIRVIESFWLNADG